MVKHGDSKRRAYKLLAKAANPGEGDEKDSFDHRAGKGRNITMGEQSQSGTFNNHSSVRTSQNPALLY